MRIRYLFSKSIILLFFLITIQIGCSDKEKYFAECICENQTLIIEFVNADGINLLENGAYDPSKIKFTKNRSNLYTFYNEAGKHIQFEIEGDEGDSNYEIQLNETETDMLVLNLSFASEGCCGPYFDINSALYNDEVVEIDRGGDSSSLNDKIVILK